MKTMEQHTGVAARLPEANMDTDQIIPKQFLKVIEKKGLGKHLFHGMRYREDGGPNPDFELNAPAFEGASILVAGDNFGCGSSREHAPWALHDFGFRVLISSRFADIFKGNCILNGILPVTVAPEEAALLMEEIRSNPGVRFTVNLAGGLITTPGGTTVSIGMDTHARRQSAKDRQGTAVSPRNDPKGVNVCPIAAFEARQKTTLPWLWG